MPSVRLRRVSSREDLGLGRKDSSRQLLAGFAIQKEVPFWHDQYHTAEAQYADKISLHTMFANLCWYPIWTAYARLRLMLINAGGITI